MEAHKISAITSKVARKEYDKLERDKHKQFKREYRKIMRKITGCARQGDNSLVVRYPYHYFLYDVKESIMATLIQEGFDVDFECDLGKFTDAKGSYLDSHIEIKISWVASENDEK